MARRSQSRQGRRGRPAMPSVSMLMGKFDRVGQTACMHSAWERRRNKSLCPMVPGADRFTVLQALCDSPLFDDGWREFVGGQEQPRSGTRQSL